MRTGTEMERRGRWCQDGEERGRGVHLIREILLKDNFHFILWRRAEDETRRELKGRRRGAGREGRMVGTWKRRSCSMRSFSDC
jgi:hypothetical protein